MIFLHFYGWFLRAKKLADFPRKSFYRTLFNFWLDSCFSLVSLSVNRWRIEFHSKIFRNICFLVSLGCLVKCPSICERKVICIEFSVGFLDFFLKKRQMFDLILLYRNIFKVFIVFIYFYFKNCYFCKVWMKNLIHSKRQIIHFFAKIMPYWQKIPLSKILKVSEWPSKTTTYYQLKKST